MGPLPSSYSNEYILVVVDYVSTWVEVIATQKAYAKIVICVLKRNIFCMYGTPRVLIDDGNSHFCNSWLKMVLEHYDVKHKIVSPYHPQKNGRV